VCCAQTVQSIVKCQDQGCKGTIEVTQCDYGITGTGANYQDRTVYCCGQAEYELYAPSGRCEVETPKGAARARIASLHVERVWVRSCNGRYVLRIVPVAS
jgi:hypothetical protein